MPNNNTTPEKILDIGGTEYLWGKIKDYQRDNRYIYSVKGTQTQSTNVWTGKIEINQLYNGLTIAYYLPYAGNSSNVTLNLTLGNNTTTGAVDVYLTGTTRLTNQYGAGSVILLTYWSSGSIKVAGTTTTNNRWLRADYDANTITTATTTGSGNAVTSISASNGALTVTKGSTFLTAHPTITTSTDTTSTGSPSHGGTFTAIDSVTRDTNGHVTKVNTKTITLPSDSNTDTKVNVTLGTTTKAYILGTSTTPTSTAKAVTSISDTGVYLDTTAGRLRATTYGITNGNYVNILSSSTLSANATQTFPSTGGTLLNTGTTSYTQTVTSSATNAYEIGKIKINGTETTIYGKYTDTNTDTKVTQSNAVANINRPLLLSHDDNSVTDITTNTVYRNPAIYANPSTGIITSTGYAAYNGDITIRKDTSIANDLPATLQFINYQSDNNITTNKSFIKVHDDYDAYASGANMLIQSGGNVIIGSGESPSTIYSSIVKSNYPTTEHLWLTTDIGIKIVVTDATDVTDVSKYKTFELSNSGNFYQTTSAAYDNDGFGIIGTKDRRFAEGNFHHIDVTTGVYYHKSYSSSSEDTFPLIYFNTSNIWIGATGATVAQHKGNLNLSAGFDITNNVPFESAKVAVANSDNTSATAYDILHKGNTYHLLTSSDDAWSSVGVPLTSGYIFKVLRIGNGSSAPTPPAWAGSKYDNGLVVGNVDGKMLITAGMDTPRVTFAGGHNSSTVTKPQWYFKLTGTNGFTYNLDNFSTTDVKVAQNNTTTNAAYRVLLSYSSNDTNETNTARKSSGLTYNPSTGVLGVNGYTVSGTSNSSYNFDDFSTIKRFSTSSNGQDNGWSTIVTADGIAKLQDSNTSSVYVTRHIPVSSTTAYDPPPWYAARHSVGLMFANQNQVAIMSMASNNSVPLIKFGATGSGPNGTPVADGTGPASPNGVGWYFGLTGTTAITYNLDNFLTSHPSISTSNGTLEYVEGLDNGDEFYAIDSLSRDANGHVTGYTYNKYTIATDHVEFTRSLSSGTKIGTISINNVETDIYCNNNNNVTQTNTTQSIDFRILLSNTNTDTMQTDAVYKNSKLLYNPGTGTLSTPIISLSYTNSSNTSLNFNTKIKPIVSSFNSTNYQTIQISDGTSSNNIYITPSTNNTGTIGHTSLKWNGIYATTFYGGLNGTISSNTTATTQSVTDSSTKVATTKFVKDAITDSRVIHTAIGTAGSAGWVKIATMKHTSTYNNEPIMLTIVQRGDIDTYHLQISFKSVNSTDPSLNTFKITTESAKAYLFKSATSTWDLYVKKLNTYESINVTGFSFSSFSSSHMTWTWTDTQVTDSSITSTSGTLYGGTHAVSYDVETVKLYTRVANNTTSSLKCVPFLQDSAGNLDASGKLLYSSGFCFQFRTGQAAESPTNQQDGVDVLVLGNTTVSGTAGNSSGILQLYSKLSQGIQLRANKNSDSVLPSVALPAKANTSVLMSEIIMYEYSSGDKVSTYTSAAYSTQEFAYFKVFVSLNASNSGYSCYDVIYNNASTLNEFALAWGKNTSGTGTVTLSTIMIQVSKSNNKYTFTATTSNSFSVTGSTTSSVTSPTVYIKKIIGVICESYNVL